MLLKSKISMTILVLYEMLAVSMLHFQRICDSIFNIPFCDSWYRYFLFCVIVPGLIFLVLMWIREIVRAHRRRKFIRRAKNAVQGIMTSIRGRVSEHIDASDLEKIITSAVLYGIKKYADNHPNLRRNMNDIMGLANGELELSEITFSDTVAPKTRQKRPQSGRTQSRPSKR